MEQLSGTAGFLVFVVFAVQALRVWRGERGRVWLHGAPGRLALAVLAAVFMCVMIAALRMVAFGELLTHEEARALNGAWPWIAVIYLIAAKDYRRMPWA